MPGRADEFAGKVRAVRAYLTSHDLDVVILTRRCNFAWLTGGGLNHVGTVGELGVASLVVGRDRVLCLASRIEAPRIMEEELSGLDVPVESFDWFDPDDARRRWAEALAGGRAACDGRVAGLPADVQTLAADFDALRYTLCEAEIARVRHLAREVARVLEEACRGCRPGMREHELAGWIAGELAGCGIRTPTLLVGADERVARYRHPIPTDKAFAKYGMAVVGGERDGLVVSCSRLFSFGPVSKELARKHEAVCQVDAAMIAHTRPGHTLGQVLDVAKATYARAGFPDEWRRHHQGGLAGYQPREVKALPGSTLPIQVGQMFAWNPSITGTKSEDTLLVGPETNEILTATGAWPVTDHTAAGRSWPRPDVLVL